MRMIWVVVAVLVSGCRPTVIVETDGAGDPDVGECIQEPLCVPMPDPGAAHYCGGILSTPYALTFCRARACTPYVCQLSDSGLWPGGCVYSGRTMKSTVGHSELLPIWCCVSDE